MQTSRSCSRLLTSLGACVALGVFGQMSANAAAAMPTLFVYGPGGPAPAIKDAAAVFGRAHHINVVVTAGPTPKWLTAAKANADVVYSGSENMMTDFQTQMADSIVPNSVLPLYVRPAAILVHPGNPLHIHRFSDLLKPGRHVMVVQGAGQTGMWEDIAGRVGDITTLRELRHNIVFYAPNSALALKRWQAASPPDAWIIYNIWQVAHPSVAQVVPLDSDHQLYRDCDISLTKRGETSVTALAFYRFVQSPQGAHIFRRWGWR